MEGASAVAGTAACINFLIESPSGTSVDEAGTAVEAGTAAVTGNSSQGR